MDHTPPGPSRGHQHPAGPPAALGVPVADARIRWRACGRRGLAIEIRGVEYLGKYAYRRRSTRRRLRAAVRHARDPLRRIETSRPASPVTSSVSDPGSGTADGTANATPKRSLVVGKAGVDQVNPPSEVRTVTPPAPTATPCRVAEVDAEQRIAGFTGLRGPGRLRRHLCALRRFS